MYFSTENPKSYTIRNPKRPPFLDAKIIIFILKYLEKKCIYIVILYGVGSPGTKGSFSCKERKVKNPVHVKVRNQHWFNNVGKMESFKKRHS